MYGMVIICPIQVWWARCETMGEDVAIKVIDLENMKTNLEEIRVRITSFVRSGVTTADAAVRSQNEIRIMSLCNHNNVVKYYCSFVHDGHYLWLVMPLMHGGVSCMQLARHETWCPGSVRNIMRSYGALSEEVIVVILHEILKGINYFHANDHIHRQKLTSQNASFGAYLAHCRPQGHQGIKHPHR